MEIVLNEREWVERIISSRTLGDHPRAMLVRYAIYLRENGYDDRSIIRQLQDYILRCDNGANLLKWDDAIAYAVKYSSNRGLIIVDGVMITDAEIEKIKELRGTARQKLMFTLLCLAKFRNQVRKGNNGWINYKIPEIFSLANVRLPRKRSMMLIHEFGTLGLIGYNNLVDSVSIRVCFNVSGGTQLAYISDFRNLGNQYMRLIGEPYIECSECGLVVKRTGTRQKYCSECAKIVNRMKTAQRAKDITA